MPGIGASELATDHSSREAVPRRDVGIPFVYGKYLKTVIHIYIYIDRYTYTVTTTIPYCHDVVCYRFLYHYDLL